jgi:hypothetical protein
MSHSLDVGAEHSAGDWAVAVDRIARELPDLVSAAEAQVISTELAPLLSRMRESGSVAEQIVDEIAELLTAHDSIRRRLNQLLGHARRIQRYPGYAGDTLVSYDKYVCPECERAWVVLDTDEDEQPPERCPDDLATLMFTPGS